MSQGNQLFLQSIQYFQKGAVNMSSANILEVLRYDLVRLQHCHSLCLQIWRNSEYLIHEMGKTHQI